MIASTFDHIKITGVASAAPTHKVHNEDYAELFGKETVDKIIASTGVRESYHVHEKQVASDLAFAAAENLLQQKGVDPQSIGALLFAVSYPDYFVPPSAFVLHKRLGLSTDCIVYDFDLACSSVIYGLQLAASLLQSSTAQKALFLVGDTTSKTVSPYDTSRLLFGDGGGAILLEKKEESVPMQFGLKSDGSRFKAIIVPAGGFRNPNGSREMDVWSDSNRRSDYNLYMNGTDVFSFTMTDVPALFKEFMEYYHVTADDVDKLVMHQPNAFILKHLAKKIKIPMEKVPLSLDRYGNTSGASIPFTLSDTYGGQSGQTHRLIIAGFGVGLSWGVATLTLDTDAVLPIIHTDDYYQDGGVSHN